MFTEVYAPPKTDGSGNIRENQKIAAEIFKRAGWEIQNGKLTNVKTGKRMTFEIIIYDTASERYIAPFIENLKRAGIDASYRRIDSAQWVKRVEVFDFDMTGFVIGESFSPGNEQRNFWSSQAADTPGSFNFAGIKNKAVDSLINDVIEARNFSELLAATRSLDRVMLWNFYVIPEWYLNYHRIAYQTKLSRPKVDIPIFVPLYDSVAAVTWWSGEKTGH